MAAVAFLSLALFVACVSQPSVAEHAAAGGGASSAFLAAAPLVELRDEVHQAISEALGANHDLSRGHFGHVREGLLPLWRALSKNQHGRIDKRSLRYAVHRYLMRSRSISVLGLEPLQQGAASSAVASLFTDHAPLFVRDLLEGGALGSDGAHAGFSLDDVVAMAAMLEELVMHHGQAMLEAVYKSHGWQHEQALTRVQVGILLETYLVRWMMSGDRDTIKILEKNRTLLETSFEDWATIRIYAAGIVKQFERDGVRAHGARWNPLDGRFTFADVLDMTGRISLGFGSFWYSECERVKTSLESLEQSASGRVRLSDFHGAALSGEWRFSESKDYLRNLGALDETSSTLGPRVIIPNYLQGASNCIVTDDHFRVCCASDCEPHIAEFEEAVQGPMGAPELILAVAGNMTVGLEDDASQLTEALTTQLYEIAKVHNGQVPLHGRLFGQWLHYVFPRDCPFPHKAGTVASMAPLEYGDEYMASDREIEKNVAEANYNTLLAGNTSDDAMFGDSESAMAQWSREEEELLSDHIHMQAPWQAQGALGPRLLCLLALAAALAGLLGKRWSLAPFGTDQCSNLSAGAKGLLHAASDASWGKAHLV